MVLKIMEPSLAHLIILYAIIEIPYCSCQVFKPFVLASSATVNLCNEETQPSLVEDFFNTVFAEFPSSQPACVCIQLCSGHSTFCYPNGCFQHIKGYIKNKNDADPNTKQTPVDAGSESFIRYSEDNDVINDTFRFKQAGNMRKVITPSTRRMSIPMNPFKDRFQLLSYLNYKLPKTFRNNYYDFDNIEQDRNIVSSTSVAFIDMDNTQWPKTANITGQTTAEFINEISNENNTNSSTVRVKAQIEPFANVDDEQNDISMKTLSGTDFDPVTPIVISDVKNETKAGESDQLKVLPATTDESIPEKLDDSGDKINITIDDSNDSEFETSLPYKHPPKTELDSITQIIVNATDKSEGYFRAAARKSFLSRRLPLFDLRRLKNQIRRKNRLGNEVRAHSRFANKKHNRLHQRVRDRHRRLFEIEPTILRGLRTAGKTKRSGRRDASAPPISIGDLEILNTALEIATVATEREPETKVEHN